MVDYATFVKIIEGTAESGKVLTFFNEQAIETGDNVSFKPKKISQSISCNSKYTLSTYCKIVFKNVFKNRNFVPFLTHI